MQAPLRKGKEGETLGRANGIKRTGRSFLLGLILIGAATISCLFYTWERVRVERMLDRNYRLEKELDHLRNRNELLSYEVAELGCAPRLTEAARRRLGMDNVDWEYVYVIRKEEE